MTDQEIDKLSKAIALAIIPSLYQVAEYTLLYLGKYDEKPKREILGLPKSKDKK